MAYKAIKYFVALWFVCAAGVAHAQTDPIVTESTTESTVTTTTTSDTTITSPPPSAISPAISASNSDLCTVGVSGAVQTQILGLSAGSTVRDMNCERLKLSKTLYDMGMKVAAVSALCQDERVFQAMWYAGTPCPIDGKIGEDARNLWIDIDEPNAIVFDKEEPNAKRNPESGEIIILGFLAFLTFSFLGG